MKQLTSADKKKMLLSAFWDKNIDGNQLVELVDGKINTLPFFDKKIIYSRLLSTFDWYTLLKLIPEKSLKDVLADDVLERLYPKELKEKYTYARSVLFK
ncbi:MAG: hypothetical protein K8S13_03940 [Desulfobacula sp.]|uniref:hypothetical protein n=1 Tax=Desulfobacula sp. TaxID=2593537 RepID=UPI0025BE7F21|nr:hypothetical protein [Desulfobacula sp.]MCD4718996.1 hypothetical protein [Desulfobacula sp.]